MALTRVQLLGFCLSEMKRHGEAWHWRCFGEYAVSVGDAVATLYLSLISSDVVFTSLTGF